MRSQIYLTIILNAPSGVTSTAGACTLQNLISPQQSPSTLQKNNDITRETNRLRK